MPVPFKITAMGRSAYPFLALPLRCGRGPNNMRNFHVFLELTMQAKHDGLIAGYCESIDVVARRGQDSQVEHDATTGVGALTGFYVARAATAAAVVVEQMEARWNAQPEGRPTPVFTRLAPGYAGSQAAQVDALVQHDVQPDGYQYEISYWYDGPDIYVLYHCAPERVEKKKKKKR